LGTLIIKEVINMERRDRIIYMTFGIVFLIGLLRLVFAYPDAVTGKRVYDFSNTLSSDQISSLQDKCLTIESKSTYQVAVVLINSLEGSSIEDYAYGLFNKWGIGQKDKDNGLLILISINDRKYRFETGYGTETAITDGEAGRIGRDCFVSNFRSGNYYAGIDCSLNQVSSLIFKEENINGTETTIVPVYNFYNDIEANSFMSTFMSLLPVILVFGVIVTVFSVLSSSFSSLSSGGGSPEETGGSGKSSYDEDYNNWSYPRVCPFCGALLTLWLLRKDRHCPKCGKLVPRKLRKKKHTHDNYIFIPVGHSDSSSSGSSGGSSGGSGGYGGGGGGSFGGGSSGGGGASGGW
jgi:uncharacterized protein